MQEQSVSFEKSFERLEHILEQLNSGKVNLEEALKLYEEADNLIVQCQKKLTDAEKKIELLVKNRTGDIQLSNNRPLTEDLPPR